uniref:Peroxisomal ATPase PEX1 n=1 Tax=Komagataella pastoris TaxID=4922 RepID=PEX1_PICPA|nr:RecName: Full=Peroxisomal ATPase PEX1; AltName: Full=Peroxin-1; AltName: Full=Peroxisome biosynthesis protein PAS1 [Komagataella pastoris]CAA85450.1 PAS1 [Komagataella pastoris]
MNSIDAVVRYSPLRNNLCNLPSAITTMLFSADFNIQQIIVELSWVPHQRAAQRRIAYCGWAGGITKTSSSNPVIEIDRSLASAIDLQENVNVTVNVHIDAVKAITVELEPVTSNDWEIVETHAQVLETYLLNQTRCVYPNQVLVVYPTPQTTARLLVKKIEPEVSTFAQLFNDTEVQIAPKVQKRPSISSVRSDSSGHRIRRVRSSTSTATGRRSVTNNGEVLPSMLRRSITLPNNTYAHVNDSKSGGYKVYCNLNELIPALQNAHFVSVSVLVGPGTPDRTGLTSSKIKQLNDSIDQAAQTQTNAAGSSHPPESSYTETGKVIAELVHDSKSPKGNVGLSELLACSLGIENTVGNLISLEQARKPLIKKPTVLVLHKYTTVSPASLDRVTIKHATEEQKRVQNKKERDTLLTQLMQLLSPLLDSCTFTNCVKLPKIGTLLPNGGLLQFKRIKSGWTTPLGKDNVSLEIGEEILRPESFSPSYDLLPDRKTHVRTQSDQYPTAQENLIESLSKIASGGSLLFGTSGSGKSLVISQVAQIVTNKGHFVKLLNCDKIMSESYNNLRGIFEDIFSEVSWKAPSLLILEDLDSLIPAEQEHSDSSQSRQLSEYFISKLSAQTINRDITILASSKSKESLNSLIFTTHLIEHDFQLRAPDKEARKQILQSYLDTLNVFCSEGELLNNIAVETEGYLPKDLKVLCDRAYHDLISRDILADSDSELDIEESSTPILNGSVGDIANKQSEIENGISGLELTNNSSSTIAVDKHGATIQKDNFDSALSGYIPQSLRGVKLQKSDVRWDDIGGLRDAKSILLETLEWPTKYAPIFSSCPLRLRSGILLYGYPGCGKTLLASAVAAQCGLNFISIKGPEILNKYIGPSEQSVRELFERAQAAKPCILFFDEFDSIAPKRGHDSTGVTDRVVNQMLTQMDGAEGLDGVYVLAATSRPDLIDSALLRPGRLDKSVICDMPDFDDRLDILQSVTRNMNVSKSVNLSSVAGECSGFSGADLQALAYNAYLKAVHEKLTKDESMAMAGEMDDNDDKKRMVECFQFSGNTEKKSLIELKPSDRATVIKKLEHLYQGNGNHAEGETKSKLATTAANSVIITSKDFEDSLSETKQSISQSEKRKLEAIYQQFISGRDGNMPDGTASNEIGARSTLM